MIQKKEVHLMLQIVTDSSALYSPKKAEEEGFVCLPLQVIADSVCYRDFETIDSDSFEEKTKKAEKLSTSQPSIGEKIAVYNELLENPENEVLDITMADGLSGTYQSALMARDNCDDPARVHVYNSKTLCGPHQAMVQEALRMAKENRSAGEIMEKLDRWQKNEASSVAVSEIMHLVRSGRLPNAVGSIGNLLKLMPLAVKTDDGKSLSLFGTARTIKKMIELQEKFLLSKGFDSSWTLFITHGNNPAAARKAVEYFSVKYPGLRVLVQNLNAMFMVHGGPGCLAVQAMKTD